MTQEDQKKILAFIKLVEKLRDIDQKLDKAMKNHQPALVRQYTNEGTVVKMHIDAELPVIKSILSVIQTNLFE